METPNILTKEHHDAGLTLKENDFNITLRQGDKTIAMFGHYVEIAHILCCADQAMKWTKSGITFERGEV